MRYKGDLKFFSGEQQRTRVSEMTLEWYVYGVMAMGCAVFSWLLLEALGAPLWLLGLGAGSILICPILYR